MPINWVDVPDPKNPPAGAPKISAANLARFALVEDISVAGTPTGDALDASFVRYVVNGSSTSTARPAGAGLVIWVGSVASVNMLDGDIRISTS